MAGANAWEALAGGWQAAVLAELFDKMGDLAQALKVSEWQSLIAVFLRQALAVVRPTHGNGSVGTMRQADDHVWIDTPANADDRTPLAA